MMLLWIEKWVDWGNASDMINGNAKTKKQTHTKKMVNAKLFESCFSRLALAESFRFSLNSFACFLKWFQMKK